MKRLLVIAMLVAGCLGPPPDSDELSEALSKLETVTSFGSNPGARDMVRYAPAGAPSNAPLVLVLHGCSQQAVDAAKWGWNELAEKWKFYVLYP